MSSPMKKKNNVIGINAKQVVAKVYLEQHHLRDGYAILDFHKNRPEYTVFEQLVGDPLMASLIQRISYLSRHERRGKFSGVAQGISPHTVTDKHPKSTKQYLTDYLGCHRNTLGNKNLEPWRTANQFKKGQGLLIPSSIDFNGKLFSTWWQSAYKVHSLFWYINPDKSLEYYNTVMQILAEDGSGYLESVIFVNPDDNMDVRDNKASNDKAQAKMEEVKAASKKKEPVPEAPKEKLDYTTQDGATFVNGDVTSLEVKYVKLKVHGNPTEQQLTTAMAEIAANTKNIKFSNYRIKELLNYEGSWLGENDVWPTH